MNIVPIEPPRRFRVGRAGSIELKDCARITLDPDEQVTFITDSGTEFDVVRKEWGYYALPSLNGRLPRHGLRPVLGKNETGQYFLWLVERGRESEFDDYAGQHKLKIVARLDEPSDLSRAEKL